MIYSIHIKNIALIEDCTLIFDDNLNVLSGETGAGKSIIIDSIGFVLGARADKSLIRHGENCASVEAVFDLTDSPAVKEKMIEIGLEEEETLIIYRTMSDQKSDIRINGRPATLSMLKDLTTLLVDILGQHEHQSLLSVSSHIRLLDKYGEKEILPLKGEISDLYEDYRTVEGKLSTFGDEGARARKLDLLKYQIDEIQAAELKVGEEEDLLRDRERFRNSERILNAVASSHSTLDGEEPFSLQSAISASMNALRQAVSFNERLEKLYQRLDSASTELKDVTDELSDYLESFDFDNAKADYIEKRVDLIRLMKRKYGSSIEEILENLSDYEKEYAELADADEEIARLQDKSARLYRELCDKCRRLSALRKEYASKLKKEIEGELSALGMKGSLFETEFVSGEEYIGKDGYDRAEFLISPNPGEPLRPLSKIISGGEMSRFMLALKVITARLDGIKTLIFDEVDAGISGRIGEVVAEKLALISRSTQVIAITHLPQVASMSDSQYLIEKSVSDGVTKTQIHKLDEAGVVGEIERLSAGAGAYGALHAKELRAYSLKKKQEIASSISVK